MGQQSNPNSLRPQNKNLRGHPIWDKPNFNYITQNIHKLVTACCKSSNLYLNEIYINLSHDYIFIEIKILHLYNTTSVTKAVNRFIPPNNSKHQHSWRNFLRRIYLCQRLILDFTGLKKIKLKITRTIVHSRSIPIKVRQKTTFYLKKYNKVKFNYAHAGIKILYLIAKQKTTVQSLTSFIKNNIRTRSKRKKHIDFLKFLKHCFESLKTHKVIKGIKIQIKGRFGHKPKGRSKIWKYQLGTIPLNTLKVPIQYNYKQAQTKLGAVGIKAWIYKTD